MNAKANGTINVFKDAYMKTTGFRLEYRFDALVAPKLNQFLGK